MPSELGAYLQRHREEAGLTLEDVERVSHIRLRHLTALEAGDWDALPPSVYLRGILRNYARAVKISPAGVLRMYVKERPNESRLPEPQLINQPLLAEPRISREFLTALGLFLVAGALLAWVVTSQFLPFLVKSQQAQNGGSATPAAAAGSTASPRSATAVAVALATSTSAAPASSTAAMTTTGGTPVVPLPDGSPAPTGLPGTPVAGATVTATTAITAAATATFTPGRLAMDITAATSDVWMRVLADDSPVFADFVRQGESRRFEAKGSLRVRLGTAGAARISLNGAPPLSDLGKVGEVREYRWRLLPNGDIEQTDLSAKPAP